MTDIGEIAKAVGAVAKSLQPSLEAYESNRFERLREEYNKMYQAAASNPGNSAIVLFVERMCAEAGNPVGLVSANSTRYIVPEAHLNQLIACCIDQAVGKKELAALLEALRKG